MRGVWWWIVAAGCALAVQAGSAARGGGMPGGPQAFDATVETFFDGYYRLNPSAGTAAGFHDYDRQLEDDSPGGIAAAREFHGRTIVALDALDRVRLDPDRQGDYDLIRDTCRSALLELDSIRMWQKNPDSYTSALTNSIFVLMSRRFAPPAERLASVIARERLGPAFLQNGRANLTRPPRVYTEVAIEQIDGIEDFFRRDVPAAFSDVTDKALLDEFGRVNSALLQALHSYGDFLRSELLSRSTGDFRIGAGNYRRKLLYEERVDIPLERLLEIGTADLRRNQENFRRVATLIDPTRTPEQVLEEVRAHHPRPEGLLQAFRDVLGGLHSFIAERRIITIPSPLPPIVEETPPFMRALTSASMDTPGAYESKATEAYFNVTLPEHGWNAAKTRQWMEGFNRGVIVSTAIHEAYPGHYTQFLWMKNALSKTRRLLGCASNAEGWAHYSEQMMLDQGYGRTPGMAADADKAFLELRLGQLQDALLRNARYVAGIRMHTGDMTIDQATEFFVKEGYQTGAVAEREAKRGTSDPTYLVYTLGKLQFLKLRADCEAKMGAAFNLRDFHDACMRQGFPPIAILRRALLGAEGSVL